MLRRGLVSSAVVLIFSFVAATASAQIKTPEEYFGFRLGTDGEVAAYPKVVEYMQELARLSDRVKFEELGTATMGTPYVLVTITSTQNLARLDRLMAINRRLADPRGLSEADAMKLAREGRPFYLLYATIHSTEIGNGQAVIEVAHRLATDTSLETREILDNLVLLLVPSQNPDGQNLVIDHWYKTKGTQLARNYPDLYHKYTGHDDNRDWFMFTQKETRLMIEKVQNAYVPQLTHDMHQQGAGGSRIFVPPFQDPYDPNVHPIIAQQHFEIGQAMATALVQEGKPGVEFYSRYDMWTPARQYMVYHGQPRILTEIASANFADPYVNPRGADQGLGPQERSSTYPMPYTSGTWTLRQIVDYGTTVVFAGLRHMAKYHESWLANFYRIQRDWVDRTDPPYAFVVPAAQRDPFETYELLDTLRTGAVEIHRARAPFSAGGTSYPAGSWVVKTAQPFGAFAKTMLERQDYPDLREFPGGPPKRPYDVTGHTLWMLLGVEVDEIEQPFEADLEPLPSIEPVAAAMPARPTFAYLVGPESNAGYLALSGLQKANVPVYRAAAAFDAGGRRFAPGTWIVAPTADATRVLADVAKATGLPVAAADAAPAVDAYRVKPGTRIGLWKGAGNAPGGWMQWLFEQYGFNHQVVSSLDFQGDLSAKYDVIVLPSGTSRQRIVSGLDPRQYDQAWAWAYGVGEEGWKKLAEWVRGGGTLVADGSAVATAIELLDLPIEPALPESRGRGFGGPQAAAGERTVPAGAVDQALREAFQSPAQLIDTLQTRVVNPSSLFYCPGSLLAQEFDPSHPIAFGMPARWPVFFDADQAYRLRPGFETTASVAARYPASGSMLESGWLLGGSLLRDQANAVGFRVGKGYVATIGTQATFRAQPRATFKLVFNAMFHGPSTKVTAAELTKMR